MTDLDRAALLDFLLDHYQDPRCHGELPGADVVQQGGNPGCGDVVTIYLKVGEQGSVQVQFTGSGCTISQAAASILAEHVQGFSLEEIEALDHNLMVAELGEELVQTRPRCANLALETLKTAVHQYRIGRRGNPE